jgi:hypothetical protein
MGLVAERSMTPAHHLHFACFVVEVPEDSIAAPLVSAHLRLAATTSRTFNSWVGFHLPPRLKTPLVFIHFAH